MQVKDEKFYSSSENSDDEENEKHEEEKENSTNKPYVMDPDLRMLLKNTNKPVSEISFAAGFNSVEYFATAFRQKYKANPSQYRNSSRNTGINQESH